MSDLDVNEVVDALDITSLISTPSQLTDRWKNDDRTFLVCYVNTGPRTFTISKQRDEAFLPGKGDVVLADISETISAGPKWMIMRAPRLGYTDPLNGFASVTYNSFATLSVGAFRQSRKR